MKREKPLIKPEIITALTDTFLIILFTTLPTLIGLFLMFFGGELTIYDLYKSGEFLLYSVSFLGSTYVVLNPYTIKYKNLNNFSKITIAITIIISIAYVALRSIDANSNRLTLFSIVAIIIAISFFFTSQIISSKESPNVAETRKEEIKTLQNELV